MLRKINKCQIIKFKSSSSQDKVCKCVQTQNNLYNLIQDLKQMKGKNHLRKIKLNNCFKMKK